MAHLPSFPEPSKQRDPAGQSGGSQPLQSQFSFAELKRLLGQHGAESTSEDLALDLLLHEIASEACAMTRASGAAIALWQGGRFVCRATTGDHAPDLGSNFSADSGLSGACIQSRAVQRCDDTDLDPRVDAVACRRLGARSLLVVPMLREGAIVGILEVFSPRPRVYNDGDIEALAGLSRRMLDRMMHPPEKEPAASTLDLDPEIVRGPTKDPWIPILTVLVIVLALVLGWMIGRRGWGALRHVAAPPAAAAKVEAAASHVENPSPAVESSPTNALPSSGKEAAKLRDVAPGGLVVYEKGKLIFRERPVSSAIQNQPVQIPPDAAQSLILERVEPEYPPQARLARIQGPVVLELVVDETGSVQRLQTISGDPHLAGAATDAVRQWRFKPYVRGGQALRFQTQITLAFKLP